MYKIFGVDQVDTITKSQFQRMNPSLIWMVLHDECHHEHDHSHDHHHHRENDIEEKHSDVLPHWHWFVDKIFIKYSKADAKYATITKKGFFNYR